ncbi:MAG: WcaI family glycosyltransferase [Novosphingobium sp.]
MRVLVVGLNYAPEPIGIGPYTTGMAEWLAARGHTVSVIAGRPYYPQWRAQDAGGPLAWRRSHENGVEVLRCPHYIPADPSGLRRILHHLSFALAALLPVLWHALRRRPAAVICIMPSLLSGFVARLGAWLGGARLWLHVQDFELDAALALGLIGTGSTTQRMLLALERTLLRSADTVSTISPRMVELLRRKGVKRTCELRNWANPAFAWTGGRDSPYRAEWNLAGKTVALYAGSIGRKQGARVIVEAARALHRRGDIAFVICGHGPSLPALREAAAGLGNVQFHPLQPSERMGELLALADVHLLPQTAEAGDLVLPSKLTNMLLSGRPVIATAPEGGGIFEEIAGCGLAVAPGDAAAMAAAVIRLADDPELAARLGAEAARQAGRRWSRDTILGAFEQRLAQVTITAPPG